MRIILYFLTLLYIGQLFAGNCGYTANNIPTPNPIIPQSSIFLMKKSRPCVLLVSSYVAFSLTFQLNPNNVGMEVVLELFQLKVEPKHWKPRSEQLVNLRFHFYSKIAL